MIFVGGYDKIIGITLTKVVFKWLLTKYTIYTLIIIYFVILGISNRRVIQTKTTTTSGIENTHFVFSYIQLWCLGVYRQPPVPEHKHSLFIDNLRYISTNIQYLFITSNTWQPPVPAHKHALFTGTNIQCLFTTSNTWAHTFLKTLKTDSWT